jgi:hypothetical protein
LIKLLSFPRRLVAQIIKPFRDQEPASVLIRETAKKEWKLILLNFLAAIVQAAAEGLTLGVMFLAVEVLQKSGGGLTIGDNQYLRAFPQIGQAFSQSSVRPAARPGRDPEASSGWCHGFGTDIHWILW